MTCMCDFDEYHWPSMESGCPVHDRPKTLSERWHTFIGLLKQIAWMR